MYWIQVPACTGFPKESLSFCLVLKPESFTISPEFLTFDPNNLTGVPESFTLRAVGVCFC